MNESITSDVLTPIEELRKFVELPAVGDAVAAAHAAGTKQLRDDSASDAAVVPLAESKLKVKFPSFIGTVRVAVIRAGADSGVERHNNSSQYLYSYTGIGETHVRTQKDWRTDQYGEGSDLKSRWHFVAPNTWHKSVAAPSNNWTLVAFHTARNVNDEFIE